VIITIERCPNPCPVTIFFKTGMLQTLSLSVKTLLAFMLKTITITPNGCTIAIAYSTNMNWAFSVIWACELRTRMKTAILLGGRFYFILTIRMLT
jgi:hypothetical protein